MAFLLAAPILYRIGQKPKKPGPSIDDAQKKVNEVFDKMKIKP